MTQEVKLKRSQCNYRADNARFLLECDFSQQYYHYYRKRLEKTRPFLEFSARCRWDPAIPLWGLAELASYMDSNDQSLGDCIIIGTIFKRMKLQPDVIDELSKGDLHIKCERYLGHYISKDDKLVLEDDDESISLVGNIHPEDFVTGIVVALLGTPIDDGGQFLVHDICYSEPNRLLLYNEIESQSKFESRNKSLACMDDPTYLMIVSGLGFHPEMGTSSILTKALQNLIDFVWGGAKYESDTRSSKVARILVLGNSLSDKRFESDLGVSSQSDDIATYMRESRQVKKCSGSVKAVKNMDDFFAQLSKTIDVDVMPGPSDPSTHLMPQQPFHPCMFPKSCMFPTFNCSTNPHHATYNDNVDILATAGQNIDIISKFSRLKDPIEIMKHHLKWGNSAPSAPDNLYSVPYEDEDPFVIDFIPDVYLAGCQKSYWVEWYNYTLYEEPPIENEAEESSQSLFKPGTSSSSTSISRNKGDRTGSRSSTQRDRSELPKSRTLLITIPNFDETYSCVLLNLKNLNSHLISFA